MKPIAFAAALLAIAGCTAPQVEVKKRWSKNIVAYSFVPMYPPRGDVDVGDIRVHNVDGGAATLDSRLLWDAKDSITIPKKKISKTSALLPGIEAVRLTTLDISTIGLKSVLTQIFGSGIEATDALHIALKGLKTNEVSDVDVVAPFENLIRTRLDPTRDPASFKAFCAAAKTLGITDFTKARVSIVTRTLSVTGISYFSGTGVSNVPGNSDPSALNAREPGAAPTGPVLATAAKSALSRDIKDDEKLDIPVVIGADALTLIPASFDTELQSKCERATVHFDKAQLQAFKTQLGLK